jgi:antitoxin (DNA-binding transcriptional repressor) of toxin-antitoxin stability system
LTDDQVNRIAHKLGGSGSLLSGNTLVLQAHTTLDKAAPACQALDFTLKCVHIDSQSRSFEMETTKVGLREFRSDLAGYIASSTPVAITRHGQTVGYFIPAQGQIEAEIVALKKATQTLDKLLQSQKIDVDAVVAEFKDARKRTSAVVKKPRRKAA